jgi:hypothetical protein
MTHPEQNSCVSKSQSTHSHHIVAKYIYLYYFYLVNMDSEPVSFMLTTTSANILADDMGRGIVVKLK